MAARFRIASRESPGEALKQVALRELEAATAELASDVHEARKHCKKLRALLRLLRRPLGDAYVPLNAAVRDAARAVAGRRQLDALTELCETLRASHSSPSLAQQALWARIRRHLRSCAPQHAGGAARARTLLRGAQRTVRQWSPAVLPPEALPKALAASYRVTRRQMRVAEKKALPEHLHEWRKQAKFHGYQCALLSPLWPHLDGVRAKRMDRLFDALGDHHDLHELELLLTDAAGPFAADPACAALLTLIRRRQRTLVADAFRTGRKLFADKPRQWRAPLMNPAMPAPA